MNFHQIENSNLADLVIPQSEALLEHRSVVEQNQNLLALLGDYWYDYYADYETVKNLIGSVEALFSTQFKEIYRLILGSNIIDIYPNAPKDFSVMVFDSAHANYVKNEDNSVKCIEYPLDAFSTNFDKESINYITSNIINPRLALFKNTNYEIDNKNNLLRFYVDIFDDPEIATTCLRYEEPDRTIVLLWAVDSHIFSKDIWNRYGAFSYPLSEEFDSSEYKSVVAALQYFFVHRKSVPNISNALNILAGIPFSKTINEKVVSIEIVDNEGNQADPSNLTINEEFADTQDEILNANLHYKVTTDSENIYFINYGIELLVKEGQHLSPYQLLAGIYQAQDYITNPDWYKNARFPAHLLKNYESQVYLEGGWKEYYEARSLRTHNGNYFYDGQSPFGSPYALFKSVSTDEGGNPVEQELYELIDQVLKYNLVHIKGESNYVTYEHFRRYFAEVFDLYQNIKPGFPVYLYPIFDFIIHSIFADLVSDPTDDQTLHVTTKIEDQIVTCYKYDGSINHSVIYKTYHNGAKNYDGTYLYSEFIANKYNCTEGIADSLDSPLEKVIFKFSDCPTVRGVPEQTYTQFFYNSAVSHNSQALYGPTPDPTEPQVDTVDPTYIPLFYNSQAYHNGKANYGATQNGWDNYGLDIGCDPFDFAIENETHYYHFGLDAHIVSDYPKSTVNLSGIHNDAKNHALRVLDDGGTLPTLNFLDRLFYKVNHLGWNYSNLLCYAPHAGVKTQQDGTATKITKLYEIFNSRKTLANQPADLLSSDLTKAPLFGNSTLRVKNKRGLIAHHSEVETTTNTLLQTLDMPLAMWAVWWYAHLLDENGTPFVYDSENPDSTLLPGMEYNSVFIDQQFISVPDSPVGYSPVVTTNLFYSGDNKAYLNAVESTAASLPNTLPHLGIRNSNAFLLIHAGAVSEQSRAAFDSFLMDEFIYVS